MTCNTSAVAVCCSSASRVSVRSRAFSIAMTAWSAKVRTNSICLFGERLDPLASEHKHPDRLALAQQRHAEIGANLPSVSRLGTYIPGRRRCRRYERPVPQARPARCACRDPGAKRPCPHERLVFGREAQDRAGPINVALAAVDDRHFGAAQPSGGLDQRIQNRLQIEGRAADDLQHIAGRGLVFERFLEVAGALLQFAMRLGAGDGDHRLLGEGLQQLDLAVGEAAALSAPKDECADRRAAAHQWDRNARLDRQAPHGRGLAMAPPQ